MSYRSVAESALRMAEGQGHSLAAELDFCDYSRAVRREVEREVENILSERRAEEKAAEKKKKEKEGPGVLHFPAPPTVRMSPEKARAMRAADDRLRRAGE
ncbi:hypothetical protein SAMN04488020_103207 [Palleronia marisminoris]|uniref:Uncharacterized protein n=1 Tax=Palleronia marisminoris TaxID=315423 RepID=A0A1Y5S9F3_9RHOB|nr:hypothetical protein [Palleronia marisminoris]SFG69261.1 hypothetical protein SAMN04488020_103207 [Palleronia marisminoris]SLN35475.1 hypothetical protein PAM7066_01487 [Palleronia marisminoris]